MPASMIIGVSHKTYFGYEQTRQWCRDVADLLNTHSLSGGGMELFTFPAMPAVSAALTEFSASVMQVGAQNVCMAPGGAWTGETSASMLQEMGCRYVEIGHAERRRHFGETVEVINQKLDMAFAHQLTPVICIGEEREMAPQRAAEAALAQADELLSHRSAPLPALIFAWEPQWAIGAPAPASDEYIREVCKTLRQRLGQQYGPQCRVIYGGSAGPGLISRLWPDVDGIFLGRFAHSPSAMAEILSEAKALLHA